MYPFETFFQFLNKFTILSEDEFRQEVVPFIKIRKFERKAIVTTAGTTERYFNFIASGLARKYYKKGRIEINTQISYEGQVITSQESFLSRMPSKYFVETIEPTVFFSLTCEDLHKIYRRSPNIELGAKMLITQYMVMKDRWQMQMVLLTPRERFLRFVNKNPELLQRVPQKFLASYLNIKPETFSRFKHLIRNCTKF